MESGNASAVFCQFLFYAFFLHFLDIKNYFAIYFIHLLSQLKNGLVIYEHCRMPLGGLRLTLNLL